MQTEGEGLLNELEKLLVEGCHHTVDEVVFCRLNTGKVCLNCLQTFPHLAKLGYLEFAETKLDRLIYKERFDEKLKPLLKDPALFSAKVLRMDLFPYQVEVLRNRSKRLILVCGRQTGKSTLAAVKLLYHALTHPRSTSIIVSATLRQSLETFSKVLSFVESSVVKMVVLKATKTQILFKNRSRILCLPSGRYGSTLRGFTVHLAVVDEAAFIPSDVIERVILPMLAATNGTLWLLTTPWDKDHITYRAFTTWPREWVYHLPSSINPLISREFLEEQRSLIGEVRYRQEYEAQFIDDESTYFPIDLLRGCLGDAPQLNIGELYGGYDPGGKDSAAAFVVVRCVDKYLYVVHSVSKRNISYTQFTAEIADYHKANNLTKLSMDQTGLGNPIIEHCKELGLPVEGVTLTAKMKQEILSELRLQMEKRRLIIPYDTALINALNSITYTRSRIGGYLFDKKSGCTDDLAYALALACWGAKQSGIIIKV
ncbi:MAG: terminase large subunit [Nitrososphaerales archaeon]